MKILFSCFLLFVFLSNGVNASSLQTHTFTKKFIECVKVHNSDEQEFDTATASDSALMNGKGVISGGSLNSYWSYMNCLSLGSSGDDSTGLSTKISCPPKRFGSGGASIYVGPGLEGKNVQVDGSAFACASGSWVAVNGTPSAKEHCAETSITYDRCGFNFSEISSDGYSKSLTFTNGFTGELVVKCENGKLQVASGTCDIKTCGSGSSVSWFGSHSLKSGRGTICTGIIGSNGTVEAEALPPRYFPSLESAKIQTRVAEGAAEYSCDNGRWKRITSACSMKKSTDLTCSSTQINGRKVYTCN
jgi:hypothetical protein